MLIVNISPIVLECQLVKTLIDSFPEETQISYLTDDIHEILLKYMNNTGYILSPELWNLEIIPIIGYWIGSYEKYETEYILFGNTEHKIILEKLELLPKQTLFDVDIREWKIVCEYYNYTLCLAYFNDNYEFANVYCGESQYFDLFGPEVYASGYVSKKTGLREGKWIIKQTSGLVREQGRYKDGKKVGPWVYVSHNNDIRIVEEY